MHQPTATYSFERTEKTSAQHHKNHWIDSRKKRADDMVTQKWTQGGTARHSRNSKMGTREIDFNVIWANKRFQQPDSLRYSGINQTFDGYKKIYIRKSRLNRMTKRQIISELVEEVITFPFRKIILKCAKCDCTNEMNAAWDKTEWLVQQSPFYMHTNARAIIIFQWNFMASNFFSF